MRLLVFAYGSNLDVLQMSTRCPSARFAARARLRGHVLTFAGHSMTWSGSVATIRPHPSGIVRGVVYEITPLDLRALDRAEGAPFTYAREIADCTLDSGARARVYVYRLVRGCDRERSPPIGYVARIAAGYRFWRLPLRALDRAVQRASQKRGRSVRGDIVRSPREGIRANVTD